MNINNRVYCFILAILLIFSLVGCGDNTNSSSVANISSNVESSSNVEVSSKQEVSSENSSSETTDFTQNDISSLKGFENGETDDRHSSFDNTSSAEDTHSSIEGTISSEQNSSSNKVNSNYESSVDSTSSVISSSDKNSASSNTVSSNNVSSNTVSSNRVPSYNVPGSGGTSNATWTGPNGYVIVVPKGNKSALKSAELLKKYFFNAKQVSLSIVTDDVGATSKEILIGKTNRAESNKTLADSKLEVSVKGSKLVFDGGHDVTVDTAVKRFISRQPLSDKVCTFSESTDFVSTKAGGYKYVWGDEFERQILDPDLWSDKSPKMLGGGVLTVETTPKTTSIVNGNLKLTAYKDYNGQYHVPISVDTQKTMNYQYGYVEMRAKLSLELGSFASFWTRSVSNWGSLVKGNFPLHYAEVDMFEVWNKRGTQMISGNILKNSYDTNKIQNWAGSDMTNAQQRIVPDEEYHIFGYEWTPTEIKLYFDDVLYARFDITEDWVNGPVAGKGKEGWSVKWYSQETHSGFFDKSGTGMGCFHEPQYLIFNHHLHHKDAFKASKSVTENKEFKEADYIIDYVRLYQKDGQKLYTK